MAKYLNADIGLLKRELVNIRITSFAFGQPFVGVRLRLVLGGGQWAVQALKICEKILGPVLLFV